MTDDTNGPTRPDEGDTMGGPASTPVSTIATGKCRRCDDHESVCEVTHALHSRIVTLEAKLQMAEVKWKLAQAAITNGTIGSTRELLDWLENIERC